MKIDPGIRPPGTTSPVADARSAPQGRGSAGVEADQVRLSPAASQLLALDARLSALPVIDRARVDMIKEAIVSGAYRIDPERIAEGLIESARELVHVRPRS